MKKLIFILICLTAFFVSLYLADQYNKRNTHPTLNDSAELPDAFLIDAVIYHQRGNLKQTLNKIEGAVQSIWNLEKDVDESGVKLLEEAIIELEILHKQLLTNSASSNAIRHLYKDVLNILASVEIRVAENQIKKKHFHQAKIALRYACLHLKNSYLFHLAKEEQPCETEKLSRIKKLAENVDFISQNLNPDSIAELIKIC